MWIFYICRQDDQAHVPSSDRTTKLLYGLGTGVLPEQMLADQNDAEVVKTNQIHQSRVEAERGIGSNCRVQSLLVLQKSRGTGRYAKHQDFGDQDNHDEDDDDRHHLRLLGSHTDNTDSRGEVGLNSKLKCPLTIPSCYMHPNAWVNPRHASMKTMPSPICKSKQNAHNNPRLCYQRLCP